MMLSQVLEKKSVYCVTYLHFSVNVILDLNVVTPAVIVVATIGTATIILNMPWSLAEAQMHACKNHTTQMSIFVQSYLFY